ncbi:MAG TPA: mucoidy inhibitor MuiA family protein, partial [Kofleriaceae bacterium]|nr:mucoidy inhibitor MuiA family protein [Kofleriaceae bacterium]
MGDAVAIESRIEQITVYARGARVRRVASVRAPASGVVRLVGLPLALVDDSVRVEVEGAAVVTAVRAGVDVAEGSAAAPEESPELRAAHRRAALAATEVARLTEALELLAAVPLVAKDRKADPTAPWAAIVSARRALVALRVERERAVRDRLAIARRELDEAQRARDVAAERDARAGSARAAKLHEPRKHVELDISTRGDGNAELRVEYLVAAARWAPSYVARLDGAKASCELRAVVAQDTGEDWTGVALRLSTAEPDRFAELPELHAQKIGRRQAEPPRRGFRAPP